MKNYFPFYDLISLLTVLSVFACLDTFSTVPTLRPSGAKTQAAVPVNSNGMLQVMYVFTRPMLPYFDS